MDGAVDPITHAKRSSCQSSSYGRSPSLPTTLVNKPVLLLNTPLSLSGVRPSGGCNSCRSDRLALPDMQFKCPSTVPLFLRSHSLTTTKFICHHTPSCKMRIIFLSRRKAHPSWELWETILVQKLENSRLTLIRSLQVSFAQPSLCRCNIANCAKSADPGGCV